MLKRFLKFFNNKPDDEQQPPAYEGSYLDFLLTETQPHVREGLDACPEHDPLLLVIAEILRVSMEGIWSEEIRLPLTDQHTPRAPQPTPATPPTAPHAPPPPPAAKPAPRVAVTAEDDADDADDAIDAIDEIDDDPITQEHEDDAPDAAGDELAEDDAIEEIDEDDADDADDADEDDAQGEDEDEDAEDEADDEAAEDDAEADEDDDAEAFDDALIVEESELIEDDEPEPAPLRPVDEEVPAQGGDGLPRVDKREVLQAGRVFLGMLIENDRLPRDIQLGPEETLLARDLLVGYFAGHQNFEGRAQKLLRVVEQKFSERQFSQARILLQLFQTDRETRTRNDRNIFYEDMIQRLGIRRRAAVSPEVQGRYKPLQDKLNPAEDASLLEWMGWLEQHLMINFYLFMIHHEQVVTWRQISKKSTVHGASEYLLRYIPPRRWRRIAESSREAVAPLLREHITTDMLSLYIINQMRTCYFVLRAVGDTGLEGYLDTFFNWTEQTFEINSTRFLPALYRRSMGDADSMTAIFQDIYNRYFRRRAEAFLEEVSDEEIQAAFQDAITHIAACNLNEIPPGHYDLGGFVFDQLFGLTYPSSEFAFKVHRLS